MEEAFLGFEIEIVKVSDTKNVRYCMSMVVEVSASSNADIIHIDADGGPQLFMFEDSIAVNEVHHGLKGGWRVCESKVHDSGVKKTVSGFERCFLLIAVADTDVVIPSADIEFCVYVCVTEVANEICDEGKRVLIPDCKCVDLSIVLHGS